MATKTKRRQAAPQDFEFAKLWIEDTRRSFEKGGGARSEGCARVMSEAGSAIENGDTECIEVMASKFRYLLETNSTFPELETSSPGEVGQLALVQNVGLAA